MAYMLHTNSAAVDEVAAVSLPNCKECVILARARLIRRRRRYKHHKAGRRTDMELE